MPSSYDEDLSREPDNDPLSDAERFQIREARDSLAHWDDPARGDNDSYGYDRERVLADHVRSLLAIVDQLAPEGETDD